MGSGSFRDTAGNGARDGFIFALGMEHFSALEAAWKLQPDPCFARPDGFSLQIDLSQQIKRIKTLNNL